jgi:hypothetical protein
VSLVWCRDGKYLVRAAMSGPRLFIWEEFTTETPMIPVEVPALELVHSDPVGVHSSAVRYGDEAGRESVGGVCILTPIASHG